MINNKMKKNKEKEQILLIYQFIIKKIFYFVSYKKNILYIQNKV